MQSFAPYCDCCGLPVQGLQGNTCPRCGYPLEITREEQFLTASLQHLQRVATYGGAQVTVQQLIQRYRGRLADLYQQRQQSQQVAPSEPVARTISPQVATAEGVSSIAVPSIAVPSIAVPSIAVPSLAGQHPEERRPERIFSFKSFFADQSINIVASLGAFLILVGSLSFIITITNLLTAFLVILIVHAIFGITGAVSYRFRSLRTVSVIYTAIFVLQVPLVGFAAYRVAMGSQVHMPPSDLVAIAALYAALTYGVLATYQQFKPFGYLAAAALTVADLATSSSLHLSVWWWPSMLMVLAFPLLLAFLRPLASTAAPSSVRWDVLREPARVLTCAYALICAGAALCTTLFALTYDAFVSAGASLELRLSIVVMLVLLCGWTALFVWRTARQAWLLVLPYLFLATVLACLYTLRIQSIGYVVAFTCVALFYHGLILRGAHFLPLYDRLRAHMDALALILVGLVPWIVEPSLPWRMFAHAYGLSAPTFAMTGVHVSELALLLVGVVLVVSIVVSRTGWQAVLSDKQARWCWLLLLGGLILHHLYSVVIIWSNIEPAWGLLVCTLGWVLLAVIVRRLFGSGWADPLDMLAILSAAESLLLSVRLQSVPEIVLILAYAVIAYAVVFYQRRSEHLWLPLIFVMLALLPLLEQAQILLVLSLALPLVAVAAMKLLPGARSGHAPTPALNELLWVWPLLVSGLFYGIVFALQESFKGTGVLYYWTGQAVPASIELALLAVVWYSVAALARIRGLVIVGVGFALAALLFPTNQFWVLTAVAVVLLVVSALASRLVGYEWALPLYIVGTFSAVMMGVAGYAQGELYAASWTLLGLALLLYLIGLSERNGLVAQVLLWCAVVLALWSVFVAGTTGDLYRLPIVALCCAAIGVGIGALRFVLPAEWKNARRWHHLYYAAPWYATALVAAIMTGIYGVLRGVNYPFYGAIPLAAGIYALMAYAVSVFEGKKGWLWIVAGFACGGTLLVPQMELCQQRALVVCAPQEQQFVLYCLAGIALMTALLALGIGRLTLRLTHGSKSRAHFDWSWPWYLTSLAAMVTTLAWSSTSTTALPNNLLIAVLCAFIFITLVVMVVVSVPEILILAMSLAIWTITKTPWLWWQQTLAYSMLSVLFFAAQFVWSVWPPALNVVTPSCLYSWLAIGGQVVVVLLIAASGGLFADVGMLAHAGAIALAVLALLLFWYARLQSADVPRHGWAYSAGFLFSLVVSWELVAFRQTELSVLWLAPATYLLVAAPFLSRDEVFTSHHRVSQICAIAGALLLLLPTLWLSFSQNNLQPTLILAGESIVLFLLGLITRMRFFVLSGAGLLIVSAIHVLFLPSLGIPTFLALSLVGVLMLIIATTLVLIRSRVSTLWTELE